MAFPSSPSNNQTTIVNGIRYVYSSTKQAWTKIASASTSTDQFARDTANTASSNTIIIQGVDVTQNTRITAVDTYAGSSYSQANAANNLAQSAFDKSNSANVLAQASFDAANTASSNTIYTQGVDVWQNTRITAVDSFAQAAYNKANTGGEYAIDNVARLTANAAFNQANSVYIPSVTRFNVTNSGASAYLFDQYTGNNPQIFVRAGETLAFNLDVTGHPFIIRVSSGGSSYDVGLTHVSTTGTVTTGSSAQSQVTGTLYWKVPAELAGNTYVYQCQFHSGMVGNIVIERPNEANSAATLAQASFDAANTKLNSNGFLSTSVLVANSNGYVANSDLRFYSSNNALVSPGDIVSNGYLKSLNSSGDEGGEIFLARSQANTTLDGGITIDSYQNKIRFFEQGGSARGAYIDLTQCSGGAGTNLLSGGGGTIDQYARDVNVYQNTRITAVDSFVQSSYDKANSANILAQAAFNQANTGGGSTLDQYARDTANSASSNTIIIQGVDVWQNTRMTAIEAYAQSAYSTANSGGGGGTLDQYARDVNVYQNTQITSVQTLAQAAFDQANTGGGGGGGGNNSFTTIASYGQTNIVADSLTDTLTINGGPGIAITTDPATDTITISNTGGGANTGNGTAIPVIVNTFTGNGTQNTFTLSATPGNKDQTLVIVGGVPQAKATYSLANTTLTFTEAPDNGYNIEVIIFAQSTAQGDGISAGKSIALSMIFGG